MSFFDSLLGLNTTESGDAGYNAANNAISSTSQDNSRILMNSAGNARNDAQIGAQSALEAIFRNYGGARGDLVNQNANARDALTNGMNAGVSTLRDSNGNFAPWLQNGQRASGMLSDALGMNGASGNSAARGAFQAGPGYQWNVDQATGNAARKAASLGIAGSGNTLDAITRLSSNLANNEYGSWLDRLNGVSTQGLGAANATNANNAAIAGMQFNGGQGLAGLFDKLGTSLGSLGVSQAGAEGNLSTSLGNTLANISSKAGNDLVANNWHGADAISGNLVNNGKYDDNATNTNNSIISGLFGKGGNIALSLLGL